MKFLQFSLFVLSVFMCSVNFTMVQASTSAREKKVDEKISVQIQSVSLLDSTRGRVIPLDLYIPSTFRKKAKFPLVIMNHGYGSNSGKSYRNYRYLCNFLATKGYVVASIQHELATDDTLAREGNLQLLRRPVWERGVQNILFVLQQLRRVQPNLDYEHCSLIGHSNGGDICMLFAQLHPTKAHKIISLDSRRVAFARSAKPRLYSLRSSNQEADEGVIPSPAEQKRYSMRILKLEHTKHEDFDDSGSEEQHAEINKYVLEFLKK